MLWVFNQDFLYLLFCRVPINSIIGFIYNRNLQKSTISNQPSAGLFGGTRGSSLEETQPITHLRAKSGSPT